MITSADVVVLLFPIYTIVLMVWCRYMVEGVVVSSAQEIVDEIVFQLGKARDEIVAEIQALEDAAAAGETLDLSALAEAAQRLDDVVPDVVEGENLKPIVEGGEIKPIVPGENLKPIGE